VDKYAQVVQEKISGIRVRIPPTNADKIVNITGIMANSRAAQVPLNKGNGNKPIWGVRFVYPDSDKPGLIIYKHHFGLNS